ncbi:hypothetical protein [Demequina sediminicola]|uniref:hypothetical protein n=1 Tax=Demequina sediminicola TaxID=1095026 RepID=UPI00078461DD|nr:hypothetical protein [Demequina sediminicola]
MKYSKPRIAAFTTVSTLAAVGIVAIVSWACPSPKGPAGTWEDPIPLGQSATVESSQLAKPGTWELTLTDLSATAYEHDLEAVLPGPAPASPGVCWFIFGTATRINDNSFQGAPSIGATPTAADREYDTEPSYCHDRLYESQTSTVNQGLNELGFVHYTELYGYGYSADYWKTQRTYSFYYTVWTDSYDNPPLALAFKNNGVTTYMSLTEDPSSLVQNS